MDSGLATLSRPGMTEPTASRERSDCPTTGKSVIWLSSPFCKNILLNMSGKSEALIPPSRPTEGRLAIVTDAGRDAVDADAPLTNGAEADGEVVWS
jgi:endogenous inhibitor of DNA gyrase (YacG/DUF329 family)